MALSDIDNEPTSPNYKTIHPIFGTLCKEEWDDRYSSLHSNCWKGFWVVNYKDPQVWETIDAIVWSWRPNNKEGPF